MCRRYELQAHDAAEINCAEQKYGHSSLWIWLLHMIFGKLSTYCLVWLPVLDKMSGIYCAIDIEAKSRYVSGE